MNIKKEPLVSIVITTKNEEKNIENCLDSIKKQSFTDFEVILVDNFSEDKTVQLAEKYAVTVYLQGNERSAQRNYGAKAANGKYLIYVDADMILSPALIEQCVTKCEGGKVDALYIPEQIVGDGFWIKVRDFERSFYNGTVIDAVRFIRRDLFLQIGGFDESLIGPEDWDFDKKIKKIGMTNMAEAPIYHNEGQFKMGRYLQKKSYYTDGIQKYIQKWGSNDPEIKKQLGIRYRLIDVFVENGKWKKLLRHPLLVFGLYVLRMRVAIAYLNTK